MTNCFKNIFKAKDAGARSLAGFNYQIVYTIFKSLELLEKPDLKLTIEGIEDIDLKNDTDLGNSINIKSQNTFIQVKRRTNELEFSKDFKNSILPNFLEVYKINQNINFEIIINSKFSNKICRLKDKGLEGLSKKDQTKLLTLCKSSSNNVITNKTDVKKFLSKIIFIVHDEKTLYKDTVTALIGSFDQKINIDFLFKIFYKEYIDLAIRREEISGNDIRDLYLKTQEDIAIIEEFRAAGKGLISRIEWLPDGNPDDYIDARSTRHGHIALNCDVERPIWLNKIDKAFEKANVCIIRSSSGQGKSSLAYRYAYNYWERQNIHKIEAVQSQEDVFLIKKYFSELVKYNIQTYLLIDNANFHMKLWPEIVKECSKLDIFCIITTRQEDWARFVGRIEANYEIVEPFLEFKEAKEIFSKLKARNKVHESIHSSEEAYEKIGKPHLLMEYIYLITQGRMLRDLLQEQIKQIRDENIDYKISVLRQSSLANVLEVPLIKKNLFPSNIDEDTILTSLKGEYITIKDKKLISELHLLRSEHLCQILHENISETETASNIIGHIPKEMLNYFVVNALNRQSIDKEEFLNNLYNYAKEVGIYQILKILDGLYEAGEWFLFNENEEQFDQIINEFGLTQASLAVSTLLPIKTINFDEMIETLPNEFNLGFIKINEAISKINVTKRGLDYCTEFLIQILPTISTEKLKENFYYTSELLDWCCLCNLTLSEWDKTKLHLNLNDLFFNSEDMNNFSILAQGIYKYDENLYTQWFLTDKNNILSYLKLKLGCLSIVIQEKELNIKYIVNPDSNINDQSIERIELLRQILPFFKKYCTDGVYILPQNIKPTFDDSIKAMSIENIQYKPDIQKNIVIQNIVEDKYFPKVGSYEFQRRWSQFRSDAVEFAKNYIKGFELYFSKKQDLRCIFKNHELNCKLEENFKIINYPPKSDGLMEYSRTLYNFFYQSIRLFAHSEDIKNLVILNFRDLLKNLDILHNDFEKIFEEYPDYFNIKELNTLELKLYHRLEEYIDYWEEHPSPNNIGNIRIVVQKFAKETEKAKLDKAYLTLTKLRDEHEVNLQTRGSFTDDISSEHILPIAYEVENPFYFLFDPFDDFNFSAMLLGLIELKDIFDSFWLMPIYEGKHFTKLGHKISKYTLRKIQQKNFSDIAWETLIPQEAPQHIFDKIDLESNTIPEFEVINNIFSMIARQELLSQEYKKIKELKNSINPYDKQLYEKFYNRITNELEKINKNALLIQEDFTNYFSESNDQALQFINKFIEKSVTVNFDDLEEFNIDLDIYVEKLKALLV